MSDDRAKGFLQHIAADPDDNTPRLIYADWLDEQGDSARAELIRVQVERASLPKWEARQVPLALRESALLKKHGRKWKTQLPALKGVKWGDFRRGFVATATFTSFEVLKEQAAACWAAAPIEAVKIRWPRRREAVQTMAPIAGLRELFLDGTMGDYGEVRQLAESPLLSTLRVLAIPNAGMGDEGLGWLTASPHLGNLKALRVPGSSIGVGIYDALSGATSLTALEELDLADQDGGYGGYSAYGEDSGLDSTAIAALVRWPGMARIRSLDLSGNAVGRAGLRALLHARRAAGLKELVLHSTGLNSTAMKEFQEAPAKLRLDVLDLGDNLLEGPGAAVLTKARCLEELKVLELAECEIPSTVGRRLARSPFLATLRRLNVNYGTLGPEGLQAILKAKPPHLHTLLMDANDLGDEGITHLAESPASDTLLALHLGSNGLTDRAARALAKSKHLQSLLILRLNYNRINKRAADTLRRSPLGKRLAVFEVGNKAYDHNRPF